MISNLLIRVITLIVSVVFMVALWATTGMPNLSLLKFLSVAVFVVSGCLAVWDKWAWKLSFIQRFSKITPNISGTWKAHLESFWIDPNTSSPPPAKTVYVVIRQTSTKTDVLLISNESKSRSSLARVVQENSSWTLHYIYTNDPALNHRGHSTIHHGTAVLEVIGNPVRQIEGGYWTDRDTKGVLSLRKRSHKLAESFKEAQKLFN